MGQAKTSCRDKYFNVATNISASDKDQRREYVMTSSEFFVTQSLVSAMQDNKTMSRQRKGLSQQQQHATVRNFIVTKENIIFCHDKGREEPHKECQNITKNVETKWKR